MEPFTLEEALYYSKELNSKPKEYIVYGLEHLWAKQSLRKRNETQLTYCMQMGWVTKNPNIQPPYLYWIDPTQFESVKLAEVLYYKPCFINLASVESLTYKINEVGFDKFSDAFDRQLKKLLSKEIKALNNLLNGNTDDPKTKRLF